MPADAIASASVLVRLRRELTHDRDALLRHAKEAEELFEHWAVQGPDRGGRARAAVALHGWYTGLETLLTRALCQLDGELPVGETSPRDVLFQATGELPGVRPPIVPPALMDDLLELMAFRHAFRHACSVELDAGRLGGELERLVRVAPEVHAALLQLDAFLERALGVLTHG